MNIVCKLHPKYAAQRRPKTDCETCQLLYIIRWQNTPEADRWLGSVNPYWFIADTEEACEGLKVAPQ
jgi:hypothetical protein